MLGPSLQTKFRYYLDGIASKPVQETLLSLLQLVRSCLLQVKETTDTDELEDICEPILAKCSMRMLLIAISFSSLTLFTCCCVLRRAQCATQDQYFRQRLSHPTRHGIGDSSALSLDYSHHHLKKQDPGRKCDLQLAVHQARY